jgi:hypothetical protein
VVVGHGAVATAVPEEHPHVVVGTVFFEFFAIVGLLIASANNPCVGATS